MMKHFVFFIASLMLVLVSSCTHIIKLEVMKPAEITLPSHLAKIGIVNRSVVSYKQENKDKIFNIIEGLLTGESIGADRDASEECIKGLLSITSQQNRITYIRLPNLNGTGLALEKRNLTWDEVDKICKEHQLNGILVLESFDSFNNLSIAPTIVKVKSPNGTLVDAPQFNAQANLRVINSWRLYDAEKHKIFDEIRNVSDRTFSSAAPTERDAVMQLPNKRQMLNQTGYNAGCQFGKRISPNWIWVTRYVYKGKGSQMKLAYRYSYNKNWDKASQVWSKCTNDPKRKTAGKACYNMAVVCEVKGKLDMAVDWVNKAYENHNFKPAVDYKRQLQGRIADQERLKSQLGE